MAFSEDFNEFLDLEDFGVEAIISGASVVGIFEETFIEVLGFEGLHPVFTCAQADVSRVAHGDEIVIQTAPYRVHGIQKDGTGMVTLILENQA